MKEKELGNEAYKKKDFATAHSHYDKAIELDASNIAFHNNKAGWVVNKSHLSRLSQSTTKLLWVNKIFCSGHATRMKLMWKRMEL